MLERQKQIRAILCATLCAAASAVSALHAESLPFASDTLATDTVAKATSRAPIRLITPPGTLAHEAGYIHYFIITAPNTDPEMQIGIELADGRIAWSLLDHGTTVSPFVASGSINVNGKTYAIEHQYAIRPFSDRRAMAAFQRALPKRVNEWLEMATPYCTEELPTQHGCVSCLGFVTRVLFPGRAFGALPELPADFRSIRKNIYTTEDLLLYLTRVPVDGTREQRLRRIEALKPPQPLREELVRLAAEIDATAAPAAQKRRAAALPKRVPLRRGS